LAALQGLEDAFLALEALKNAMAYRIAEKTYPHHANYRYNGMPLDAFHFAYRSHRTRVQNSLKKIGFDPLEKELLKVRLGLFNTAQAVYLEMQQAAMDAR
jgi:hypothetical protein